MSTIFETRLLSLTSLSDDVLSTKPTGLISIFSEADKTTTIITGCPEKITIFVARTRNSKLKKVDAMNKKPERYRVIEDYRSPYPDPIVFQKGEEVNVGQEFREDQDWTNWVWCEGKNGKKAWVPKQYLNTDGKDATFNRDYNAMELSVQVGESLVVHEILNGFGMAEKPNGRKGWVPMKNMEIEKRGRL